LRVKLTAWTAARAPKFLLTFLHSRIVIVLYEPDAFSGLQRSYYAAGQH